MTKVVRQLRGGQMTIPAEFREQLDLAEGTLLQVTLADGELRVRPIRIAETGPGSPWVRELYDLFAPVRETAAQCSEQEVNAAIADAIAAVRRENAQSRA